MDKGKAPLPFPDDGASSSNSPTANLFGTNSGAEDDGSTSRSVTFPTSATIEDPAATESPTAAGGLKSALGGKAKKAPGWGKVRLAQKLQGGMTAAVEELREEAKRNMKMRRAAIKKMEQRNKMFETGDAEYRTLEYLPGLNRADRNLPGVNDDNKKELEGEAEMLRKKQYKIYAAMRGKLPTREQQEEDMGIPAEEEELDDIQVEVALESKAVITLQKDGNFKKTYMGLEEGRSQVMGEMKKDILGRTVRPWKNLSKEERWWLVTGWMYILLDFVLAIVFFYLAFQLFKDDKKMDPLAWQLTFGITAIFTLMHMMCLLFEFIEYYEVFLILNAVLIVGLTYGAINYFLEIYLGEFTCFHSTVLATYAFGVCYEGRLLVSIFISLVSLISGQMYLWRWRIFKRLQLKRRGEYTELLDLEELMTQIDTKFDKYREMDPRAEEYLLESSRSTLAMASHHERKRSIAMGIFDRPSSSTHSAGGRSAASSTGSIKSGVGTRLFSLKPGTQKHMTSTELRGVVHAKREPEVIQVLPAGFIVAQPEVMDITNANDSATMKTRVRIGAKTHEHSDDDDVHQDEDVMRLMNASQRLGAMQRKPWKAGITTGAATSPERLMPDPNASPTRKIDVVQSPRSPDGPQLSPHGGHETLATSALNEKKSRTMMKTKAMMKLGNRSAKHAPKSLNKTKVHPGQ